MVTYLKQMVQFVWYAIDHHIGSAFIHLWMTGYTSLNQVVPLPRAAYMCNLFLREHV